MQETRHFQEMLEERDICPEWAERTIRNPEHVEAHDDGTEHYLRRIQEYGDRWLRIIVNPAKNPPAKVTAFFDRRLRGDEHEN